MLPPLLGALTALALYALARGLGASRGASLATAASGALTTLVLKYATLLYSHAAAAACVTVALALLLAAEKSAVGRRQSAAEGRTSSPAHASRLTPHALSGLALGYGAVVEYPNVLLIAPVGAYLLWRARRQALDRRALLAFGAGWLAPVLLLLGYDWAAFGRPWRTSYTYQFYFDWSRRLATTYVTPPWLGLRGLLVGDDRMVGLLAVTPALLLALWGLALLARREPARAALLGGVVLTILIPSALHRTYYGGGSRDARYLLAIVPALYAPLAVWLDAVARHRRSVARLTGLLAAIALGAWGLASSYLSLLTMFGHPAVERSPSEALALLAAHWREPTFVAPSLWLEPYFLALAAPLIAAGWLGWRARVAGRRSAGPQA